MSYANTLPSRTYTPPKTWVQQEMVTGEKLNIFLRDELAFLKSTPLTGMAKNYTALTLTSTVQILVGASVTLAPSYKGATWICWASFDFEATTVSSGQVCNGYCYLDGAQQSGVAVAQDDGSAGKMRRTVSQIWYGTNLTATAHTWDLRAKSTGASGVQRCNTTHTRLNVMVFQ